MSGRNIAENGFINMAPAGIAVLVAPMIAVRLSTKGAYMFSAILMVGCALVAERLQETVALQCRAALSSMDFASCNPLAFYKLFTNGRTLATLSAVSAVQTYTDPRLMDECAALVMREKLRWNDKQIQQQLGVMAASLTFGVAVGKWSVRSLGRIGHTHSAHLFKFITMLLWSQASSKTMMRFTQLVHTFGQRQRDGVETMITDLGVEYGMGKGQLQAYKFNLRSGSNLLAPLVYARLFAAGKTMGNAGLPFVGAATFIAIAELIMCCVSKSGLKQ